MPKRHGSIQGWEQVSAVTATELCLEMKDYGVKHIIYTDISRDGMLSGPNIPATKKLTEETGLDIMLPAAYPVWKTWTAFIRRGFPALSSEKPL